MRKKTKTILFLAFLGFLALIYFKMKEKEKIKPPEPPVFKPPPSSPPEPSPPPPSPPSPPKANFDLVLQVKKGIDFQLFFYGGGYLCNPKNPLIYDIVKKESTNYYDWYYIKVHKSDVERDYVYLHILTNGKAYKVMPSYPPSYCDGVQAFTLTINWYPEYISIT